MIVLIDSCRVVLTDLCRYLGKDCVLVINGEEEKGKVEMVRTGEIEFSGRIVKLKEIDKIVEETENDRPCDRCGTIPCFEDCLYQ